MDLTTLLYYAAMGLALMGADAYWYADSIITKVEVSQKYSDAGLSADFATTLFSRELQLIFSNKLIIRHPQVRTANEQSVVSVLASALKLGDLSYAFQQMFGLDPVEVKVALLEDGKVPHILITSTSRTRLPITLLLARGADEPMPDLIRRAAIEISSQLEPYHTSLYLLEKSDVETYLTKLKALLQSSLDDLPLTPDNPQRAMYRNLQEIVALLDNDVAKAGDLFELAVKDADHYAAALLNLGFVRLQQDRYEEALAAVRPVLEQRARPRNPALLAAGYTTAAVAHWALKRPDLAERDFAAAARISPEGTDMFEYWGRMLQAMGRTAEGTQKRLIGAQNLATFEQYPEIALLYFWLAEKKGQPLRRRSGEPPTDEVYIPATNPTGTPPSGGRVFLKN